MVGMLKGVDDNLSEHKTVQKIKQMNTPKETFKNATAILSLVWSVGKIPRLVTSRALSLELQRLGVMRRHLNAIALNEEILSFRESL